MAYSDRPPPTPEDVFIVPSAFIGALRILSKRMSGSKVWWAIGGETAEIMQGVHINPAEIEVMTTAAGAKEVVSRLQEYKPSDLAQVEKRLEREAEVEQTRFPVFMRSLCSELFIQVPRCRIHGDYQIKVGEWEWGDVMEFDPIEMNLAGALLPVMPLRLASEIFLTIGWGDRVSKISDAVSRAHHSLHQEQGGEPVY